MLAKGRKVSGRGEAVAANYAFGPLEDDIIIKHRLLTRTTTTRGEPPLKKLQKKFTSFFVEIDKDEDNNYADCEKLAKAFLQELNTFEIPLLKSRAVVEANVREKENFHELKEEINRQIVQAQSDIEDLKKQLEESKIERRHKEECEAIRKLIATQPPRLETQKLIAELEKEIAALNAENTASSRLLELRKKQFALLLHVVQMPLKVSCDFYCQIYIGLSFWLMFCSLFKLFAGGWVAKYYRGRAEEFDWGNETCIRRAEKWVGGCNWGLRAHGCRLVLLSFPKCKFMFS